MFIKYAEFKTDALVGGTYQSEASLDDFDSMYWDKYGVWVDFEEERTLIPWDNVKFVIYKLGV